MRFILDALGCMQAKLIEDKDVLSAQVMKLMCQVSKVREAALEKETIEIKIAFDIQLL